MLGGFIFTMIWYVLVYFKTAPNIIGSSIISEYTINMLDPIFIGLPLSIVLTVIFSILMKQDKNEQKIMEKTFKNIYGK